MRIPEAATHLRLFSLSKKMRLGNPNKQYIYYELYERGHIERFELTQTPLSQEAIFPWKSGLVTIGKAIFKLCLISEQFIGSWECFLILGSLALYSPYKLKAQLILSNCGVFSNFYPDTRFFLSVIVVLP